MANMTALTFDRRREAWDGSTGMVKDSVPAPELDEANRVWDRSNVIIKVIYAGFCGSDRGIWHRKSFGDMVLNSLDQEQSDRRIFGHELLGEIVEVGSRVTEKYGYKVGDIVSTESHIVCGVCLQCRLGQEHVCVNDKIIGISTDGVFANYAKLPAKALWPTDTDRIRPEVAAIQEPFGNAVHACQVTDLRGKTVAILGTGTIGLFAVLIAKGMGARTVIGVEPDPRNQEIARRLGCDIVIPPGMPPEDRPHASDPELREHIRSLTSGYGVDVSMEMAGFNSSINNAIQITRRGGTIVLFGLRNGNAVLEDAHRVVMNGLQLHGVVGRQIFNTWHMTKSLLEHEQNGIQDAIWETILKKGDGPIVSINDWRQDTFQDTLGRHTKTLIRFDT